MICMTDGSQQLRFHVDDSEVAQVKLRCILIIETASVSRSQVIKDEFNGTSQMKAKMPFS
jgi:hypothetical protein